MLCQSKTAQGVMGGKENEQMGVGQDWVCFDVERFIWRWERCGSLATSSGKNHWKILTQGKVDSERRRGRPSCNDLVAGFK